MGEGIHDQSPRAACAGPALRWPAWRSILPAEGCNTWLRRASWALLAAFPCLLAHGQCPNNNTLTGTAVTPLCTGTTNVPCVQGGQYALVHVVAGNTYTFSTCAATFDTQITLYNNTGGAALGYNDDACGLQSSVTWTAPWTGQVRVLVDRWSCADQATCAPLAITCTPPPSGDCLYTLTLLDSWGDGWGTSFVSVSINGGPAQNYFLPGGYSMAYVIGVNLGDVVQLSYNASGAFQGENSYSLVLGGGGLFISGTPPAAGIVYTGIVDCQPPPATQEDCLGAITVCDDLAITNNTNHTGSVIDINAGNSGCLDTQEYQGTWYVFSPTSAGTLGMTIEPDGPDDYDWAIWGPYPPGTTTSTICSPPGPPVRCAASSALGTQYSTGSFATGMGHPVYSPPQFASSAVAYSVPASDEFCGLPAPQRCGWVPGLQVNAGEVYLLYVSNWSQTSTGFNLDWELGGGASLDCVTLPVELLRFEAWREQEAAQLEWATASEHGCERFEVERSADAEDFGWIGAVPGSGNTNIPVQYDFTDHAPLPGINYYRLRQVDADGSQAYSPVRAVQMGVSNSAVQLHPNPGSSNVEVMIGPAIADVRFLLLDATGRTVFRQRLKQPRTRLDLSLLPTGAYAYRVLSGAGESLANGRWLRE